MGQFVIFLGCILELSVGLLELIWLVAKTLFLSEIVVAGIVWLIIFIAVFCGLAITKRNAHKIVFLSLASLGLVTIVIAMINSG